MSGMMTKFRHSTLYRYYPLFRGMVSYAIIWPTCSITQEYLEHGTTIANANWARAGRFGFFGAFCMAPVFYGWVQFSSRFFKRKDFRTAITRAAIEQVSYGPMALAYFFFGMSLLEMKPIEACIQEVKEKFWPTYWMGFIYWPSVQTFNFYFISDKNRVVCLSAASFVWTIYMAHMISLKPKALTEKPR